MMDVNYKKGRKLGVLLIGISLWSQIQLYGVEKTEDAICYNAHLTYEYEGDVQESEEGYVEYQGKRYVSLAEICQLFGKAYALEEDTLKVYTPRAHKDIEALVYTHYKGVLVQPVDEKTQTIAVEVSDERGQRKKMTFAVGPETQIKHRELATIFPQEVLEEGLSVEIITQLDQVYHSHAIADEIIIETLEEKKKNYLEEMKIIEIHTEEQYLLVQAKDSQQTIMVHIDHYTSIKKQDQELSIKALEQGMIVDIHTNNMLTDSNPPQTMGLEIIIKV